MGPGRFEFLYAIRTHINIKLKMGIQKRTGAVYCSMTNRTISDYFTVRPTAVPRNGKQVRRRRHVM